MMQSLACALLRSLPALFLSCGSFAAITNPTPQRAFVATYGSDANNCGRAAPCRTLNAALNQVIPGGEVVVLDTGGFGSVVNGALADITQSVTITVPPGIYAGLSAPDGINAVNINAPGGTVTLRGLSLSAQAFAGNNIGVSIGAASQVNIENCVIANFAGAGVSTTGGQATSVLVRGSTLEHNLIGVLLPLPAAASNLTVEDSTFDGNPPSAPVVGLESAAGISIGDGGTAVISNSRFVGLGNGLVANANLAAVTLTVRDSVFNGNRAHGIAIASSTATAVLAWLTGNTISGTAGASGPDAGTGLFVNTGSILAQATEVWLNGNHIVNNLAGVWAQGQDYLIHSRGNNQIQFNSPNGNVVGNANLTAYSGQ